MKIDTYKRIQEAVELLYLSFEDDDFKDDCISQAVTSLINIKEEITENSETLKEFKNYLISLQRESKYYDDSSDYLSIIDGKFDELFPEYKYLKKEKLE